MARAEPFEKFTHLPSPLSWAQSEMGRYDLQSLPAAHHVHIDGTARLTAAEAEIDQSVFSQLAGRQYTITVCSVASQNRSGDGGHTQVNGQPLQGVFLIHFLKCNESGPQFL